jgi:hypothetical protein
MRFLYGHNITWPKPGSTIGAGEFNESSAEKGVALWLSSLLSHTKLGKRFPTKAGSQAPLS